MITLAKRQIDFPVFLAPMAGVADLTYRELCVEHGADMTFTEMVSAKGLMYSNRNTRELMAVSDAERPCALQLFGSEPELIADMIKAILDERGADFCLIDINMGCPAHKIVSNGEGSALMKNVPLAARIINAAARAAAPVPLSVKFRAGFDAAHKNAVEFGRMAEESGAYMVCVHGRTREQMYSGCADYELIGRVKASLNIPVIGNGDVFSGADAVRLRDASGVDGIMVARGARGNPFIFEEVKAALSGTPYSPPDLEVRLETALEHARRLRSQLGAFAAVEMRKHVAWYTSGMPEAASLRAEVNACGDMASLETLIRDYIKKLQQRRIS